MSGSIRLEHLRARAEAGLDTVLDRSVLGGYTSVGYRVRRHMWPADDLPRMQGKVVLITGASSGLGLAAAQAFADLRATIWLAVRNRARGEDARARLVEHSADADVHVGVCDLSDLRSVRDFAHTFAAESPRLDVLVHNAGVLTKERELSVDGIELTLATNVIGPFLLTELLIPMLVSARARIINVSSGGMYAQRIRADDLQSRQGAFDGPRAYARSKRAEVILTELWAKRDSRAPASLPTRCTPAGRIPAEFRPRCRGSIDSPGRSCARPPRGPTRSSGSAPRPRPPPARAGSGTTADAGRPTCSPAPERPRRSASACGRGARP